MSASTERKVRAEAVKSGTDKKSIAAQEAAKVKAAEKRKWTIGTIIIVLLIAFALIMNTGVLYSKTTAVKINGQSYSPAQLNYYYGNAYTNFVNTYGEYASAFGLNTQQGIAGLGSQMMSDTQSWKDYFLEQAGAQMAQIAAFSDYAAKNGLSVSAEDTAALDAQLDMMRSQVKEYGWNDLNHFFSTNYGKGVTEKVYRAESLKSMLANEGYNYYISTLSYSDEELSSYYEGLNGDYDYVEYIAYNVPADADEDGTVSEEESAAAAKTAQAIADSFAALETEDPVARMNEALSENGIEGEAGSSVSAARNLSSAYSEWLGAQTEAGSCAAIDSTVVAFISRDDNSYELGQVRHILVMAEADENGVFTDEAKAAAKARAEEILDQWKQGDATEESFAALANELSDDSAEGGLYTDVDRHSYVPEFTQFALGNHSEGDTAIVYGESSSYAGYHVMYYVGKGPVYSSYIAENLMKNEAIESWTAEITAPYEVVKAGGYRYAAV